MFQKDFLYGRHSRPDETASEEFVYIVCKGIFPTITSMIKVNTQCSKFKLMSRCPKAKWCLFSISLFSNCNTTGKLSADDDFARNLPDSSFKEFDSEIVDCVIGDIVKV